MRALLIGSPYGGLLGTQHDVEAMRGMLQNHGFPVENITTLCNESATRENILGAWRSLIGETSSDDVLVIYYSGHGGLAQSDTGGESDPSRLQFIVPYDFDSTLKTWQGIFDGELSQLLLESTTASHNVTYILDCCHSARNGREVSGFSGRAKTLSLSRSDYSKLTRHFTQLKEDGHIIANNVTTNPFAVRIAAAAVLETAWECNEPGSDPMGVLTMQLTTTIAAAAGQLSWRGILLQVGALVERTYPTLSQHPRSAGLDNRLPFSMVTKNARQFLAKAKKNGIAILQAGRAHGIQEGDEFSVTPFGYREQLETISTTMVVTQLRGFLAVLRVPPASTSVGLDADLDALAILFRRQTRQPARVQGAQDVLVERLRSSLHLRTSEPNEDHPLVEFRQDGDTISLHRFQGLQLGSERLGVDSVPTLVDRLVSNAEIFSQAQNLLSLESGTREEAFNVDVEFEFGLEVDGIKDARGRFSETPAPQDEAISLVDNDRVYIHIRNHSHEKVFVNVLNIDAAGS
ncbi:hypothetical protein CEP53_001100 [Fusarium sp. AF-6]|nr:hypothetical protein CEP53_001100 [Fusarium sp. AF-6]